MFAPSRFNLRAAELISPAWFSQNARILLFSVLSGSNASFEPQESSCRRTWSAWNSISNYLFRDPLVHQENTCEIKLMALVSKYDTHKYNSDSIIAFCLAYSISYSWSLYEITPVVEKVLLILESCRGRKQLKKRMVVLTSCSEEIRQR